MMQEYWYVIFIAGFFLIGMVQAVLRGMREKKRKHEMRAAADDLGFTYSEDAEDPVLPDGDDFELLPSYRLRCMLKGEVDGVEVIIMDYKSIEVKSTNSIRHVCTTIILRDLECDLPGFTLLSNVTGVLKFMAGKGSGAHRVTFDDDPYFTNNSLLGGEDKDAIRQLFHPELRQYINGQGEQVYEGKENLLLAIKPGLVEINDFRTRINQAISFLNTLKQ